MGERWRKGRRKNKGVREGRKETGKTREGDRGWERAGGGGGKEGPMESKYSKSSGIMRIFYYEIRHDKTRIVFIDNCNYRCLMNRIHGRLKLRATSSEHDPPDDDDAERESVLKKKMSRNF